MSNMKSYHLKWSSHLPNMGLVFATLYQTEGLSDVTLACEDGNVRAHKLLLSTCSDYFLELFLESSSKRTVVVLPSVKVADLRVIISFIYTGEVNVSEEGLSDLLEVAEMLGVRGLKAGGDENKSKEKTSVPNLNLIEAKNKDDDKADEGIEVENIAMSEDSCSAEEESHKNDTNELVPSISITRVAPKIFPAEIQIPNIPSEALIKSPESIINPEPNKSSEDIEANNRTNALMLKREPENQANNYIISDEIAEEDNDDDIEDDIEDETDTPVSVKNEPNMSTAFSSHFQPMMSQHSQYSQYFHSPNPYNFPSRTPLPSSPPFSNPLVSMSNLAAMYQQQQQSPRQTKEKTPQILPNHRPLEYYRETSQEGKVSMDLLPEDVNAIMAQSTTPFCPICNKDCGNFPNLRSHLQVHNSIRPYACTYCEAKFARVSHLNRHIRTHTGERPFGCERCGKNFARQDKLKLHMDRHLSRETKSDLMNHLISAASTNPLSESPSKKLKLENNISLKQELSSNSSTPTPQLHSPVANNINNFNNFNNGTSLWGSFPMYNQNSYQPVYPGMVPQYLTHNVSELHNVMKIGECSIKPLGQ